MLLLLFSEWLDGEGLIAPPTLNGDYRTHDKLAGDFLAHRAERIGGYGAEPLDIEQDCS